MAEPWWPNCPRHLSTRLHWRLSFQPVDSGNAFELEQRMLMFSSEHSVRLWGGARHYQQHCPRWTLAVERAAFSSPQLTSTHCDSQPRGCPCALMLLQYLAGTGICLQRSLMFLCALARPGLCICWCYLLHMGQAMRHVMAERPASA